MKISSLKRGDLIEFDCYEAHYFGKFIKREPKKGGFIAAYQGHTKEDWFGHGYFNEPKNIKRSTIKPPSGFKLPR